MNEQAIRKIVDDEIKKKLFQLPKIPPHKHDGTDNINIPRNSIINATAVAWIQISPPNSTQTIPSGIVSPSKIAFEGIAYDGVSSIQILKYLFGGPGSVGSVTATLASAWGGSTDTQNIVFTALDGSGTESRQVNFTSGSLTISWEPPLTMNDSLTVQTSSPTHKASVTGFAQLGNIQQFINGMTATQPVKGGIYQTNSCTFYDSTTGSWVPYVNVDTQYLAAIYDASFNVIASIQIMDYTNSTITIATTGNSSYSFLGTLSIT